MAVTQPSYGTVVINADGTITYAPDAEYNGLDSFTYTICETTETPVVGDPEGLCATATVTLEVTYVNDAPTVTNTVIETVVGSTPSIEITDVEGDPYVVVVDGGTMPPGMTIDSDGNVIGAPTTPGTYTVILVICDADDPTVCTTESVMFIVYPSLPRTDDPNSIPVLPRTGSDSMSQARAGILLMLFGFALLWWTRRRDEDMVIWSDLPPGSPTPTGQARASVRHVPVARQTDHGAPDDW